MNIREANEGDVDFLGWVMLEASRSHLPRGLWEYLHQQDGDQTQEFLRKLAVTDIVHFFHHSLFKIAEVDGKPAAAMCGFDPSTQGMGAVLQVMPPIASECGVTFDEEYMRRASVIGVITPDYADGAWVVENVATAPDFRRRGLTNALLEATLDTGRAKDHTLGQIAVFIGNDPARAAYIKAGFEPKDEKRDPTFEAELGSAGTERLLQPL